MLNVGPLAGARGDEGFRARGSVWGGWWLSRLSRGGLRNAGGLTWGRGSGDVRAMNDDAAATEFSRLVTAVLRRFFAQNGCAELAVAEAAAVSGRLWSLVRERGLPRALREGECGVSGGMSEEACAPLVGRVLAGANDDLLAKTVTQLVKACFYPEFTVCRDSFREVAKDGSCKRQELARVRQRVSGTHCVDCPHWVALTPAGHGELLQREWRGAPGIREENCGVFLPEDFRALRRWLHARARV